MIIYTITNKVNGKIYVGKRAKSKDKFLVSNYFGSGIYIKRAIKKYGLENFIRGVVDEAVSLEDLSQKEIFWIQQLNSAVPNGYNIQKGGLGGDNGVRERNITPEWRAKINKALKGRKVWNKGLHYEGKPRSIETKIKMSNAAKGKRKSVEHRKHLSESCKGRKVSQVVKDRLRNLYLGRHRERGTLKWVAEN